MSNIAAIDPNFKVETQIEKTDIRFYNVLEEPFQVYGVFYQDGKFRRLPESVAQTVSPSVLRLHSHTAGGRIRFRTNSPYVAISAKMPTVGKMPHFALTGSVGFDLYEDQRHRKCLAPPFAVKDGYEGVIELGDAQMRDITIFMPTYSEVAQLYIGLRDQAVLEPPKPYTHETPIVYYGSSITQGGCASRPGMAYESIVSRRLDTDYINLGFSGSAKGEPEIAQYIKSLKMSVFVYDYDHNAPTMEHYQKTHEAMFRTIRDANPELPIVCMSRPQYYVTPVVQQRMDIMRATVENSRALGDKKVWMLTGPELMALTDGEGLVDGCHPTDLGFFSMAKAVGDLLATII